jgi:hypothetical protein
MLRIVEDRVHINGLALTQTELDAVRPSNGLQKPNGAVAVTYDGEVKRWSNGSTQYGTAGTWPAAEALMADPSLADDLAAYRAAREDTTNPDNPNLIAPLAFLERFSQSERTAIRSAAAGDDALADWLDLLRAATEIDLASERTLNGMQALVDAGLIASDRRDEILTP